MKKKKADEIPCKLATLYNLIFTSQLLCTIRAYYIKTAYT